MKILIEGNPNNTINLPCSKYEFKQRFGTKLFAFRKGDIGYIISVDDGKWHISISLKERIPKYAEIKHARYSYIPDDCYMAQIFPPSKEFVNHEPNTLHLYEI
jgi:hypothetical protein